MTPFGLFMRTLRLEEGLLLKDVAERMEVTSAYLSALEHGKKGVPSSSFISMLENRLKLDAKQRDALRRAVRDSSTNLAIPSKSKPSAFETAHAFARKLPSLSDRQLIQINNIVGGKE
jgi:transcriptional regulator with XRE-family HTH domain